MRAPFIATGVAAMALAAWLLSPHGARGQKASAAPTAHHDQAGDELAGLRAELTALERQVARGRPRSDAPAPADAPAAADPGRAAGAEPARPERTLEQVIHGLDKQLGREAKDPAWSSQTEARIAEAFRSEALAGSTVLRAQCVTSFCRVDVSHESEAVQHEFVRNIPRVPPFDHGGVAHPVVDPGSGKTTTVVYVGREGHAPPDLDEG
jgi:hypothetical protein